MSFICYSLNNVNILLAGTFLEYKPALEIARCSARDECIRSQVYGGRLYAILRAGSALANFRMGQKAPVLEPSLRCRSAYLEVNRQFYY